MEQQRTPGSLIIVGGAEDKEGESLVLREVVERAGGDAARLVVLTVATDSPAEVGKTYCDVFERLGVASVQVVDVSTREHAEREESVAAVQQASGVYFSGGDQLHVTSLLGGTALDQCLRQRLAEGMLLGGTSAGAAMMSNTMILGGGDEESPCFGQVRVGGGMGLLPATIIDTHFSQRGRFGRLLAAVAHYPHELGLGIDENTGLVVEAGRFRVIGDGAVTVVDCADISYTNVPDLSEGEFMALHDARVHVIPVGYEFDLRERRPIRRPLKAEQAAQQEE